MGRPERVNLSNEGGWCGCHAGVADIPKPRERSDRGQSERRQGERLRGRGRSVQTERRAKSVHLVHLANLQQAERIQEGEDLQQRYFRQWGVHLTWPEPTPSLLSPLWDALNLKAWPKSAALGKISTHSPSGSDTNRPQVRRPSACPQLPPVSRGWGHTAGGVPPDPRSLVCVLV